MQEVSRATSATVSAPACRPIGGQDQSKKVQYYGLTEIWLSILTRKVLQRGSFTSVDHLVRQILAFIEYYNHTMAKPFKWSYQGTPRKA
jgi:hypothetical protein